MKIRLLSLVIASCFVICNASCPIKPCDIITCQPGFHCVDGKCVQDEITCDNLVCPTGTHCEIIDNTPICVQDPTCTGYNCQTGFHCEMIDGKPTCVKDPIVDPCDGVTCLPGYHCEKGKCISDTPPIGCTDPLPTLGLLKINCRPFYKFVDCTPIIPNDTKAPKYEGKYYCNAVGAEESRHSCPMRFDCPAFKCKERLSCELYAMGGKTVVDSRNDAECLPKEDNPMEFWPNDKNCRLCNADKTICGDWF